MSRQALAVDRQKLWLLLNRAVAGHAQAPANATRLSTRLTYNTPFLADSAHIRQFNDWYDTSFGCSLRKLAFCRNMSLTNLYSAPIIVPITSSVSYQLLFSSIQVLSC